MNASADAAHAKRRGSSHRAAKPPITTAVRTSAVTVASTMAATNPAAPAAGIVTAKTARCRCRTGCTWRSDGTVSDGAGPVSNTPGTDGPGRSEEHTSELQSRGHLVCRLL